jgi:DNA polymerase-3 subunit delta
MTPEQFLTQIKQQPLPAYLLAGPEQYRREWCIKALIDRMLPSPEDRENGLVRHDLEESELQQVLDDAACGSLFAVNRVVIVSNAEAALPRGRGADDEADSAKPGGAAALGRYLKDPPPGVVLLFEATRYDMQGEDRKKLDRVRKFYEAVPATVEFPRMNPLQARQAAEKHARRVGLNIRPAEIEMLVEALGADAARIAAEIDKLAVYAAGGRAVTQENIAELVPEARESTVFALVAALGRNDRGASLRILDTLIRQSEYLPLALSFLATQFRLALAAREAGLQTPRDIQAHFSRLGIGMWGSRSEQVAETVSQYSRQKLARALAAIYEADRAFRDARPDDRVVMEEFVMRLTARLPMEP